MAYYPITPVPAPRQVRSDAWSPRPGVVRYRAFRDECRLRNLKVPESGASLVFLLPMPKSWSKKKKARMCWQPHQQKPDVDNLEKALLDSVYGEDCGVWHIGMAAKLWAPTGGIVVVSDNASEQSAKESVQQILRVDNLIG